MRLTSTGTIESLFRNSCRQLKSIQLDIKAVINSAQKRRLGWGHLRGKNVLVLFQNAFSPKLLAGPYPSTQSHWGETGD
jgi:hypothetical protein